MENGRRPRRVVAIWWSRRVRTDDPLLAKQVLYQLSYDPINLVDNDVIKNDTL